MEQVDDAQAAWTLESIPFEQIQVELVQERTDLFYLITAASFIEIASDTYTRNLIDYYRDDAEVATWLARQWEHEEVRHGHALRAYVEKVWPEFDWQQGYANFFEEYSKLCTQEHLEPTRGLEMAARCVVEMGTATYYRAIHDQAAEPVLRTLTGHIKNDEIGHYKHFFGFFLKYRKTEQLNRWQVFRAVLRRVLEVRNDDAEIALWHVYRVRHAIRHDAERKGSTFRALFADVSSRIKPHYPALMAVRMLLKPLLLHPRLNLMLEGPMVLLTKRFIMR
jgi:hypothetical protein